MREKVQNISSSLQRFLVTYDLVVYSRISYLTDDALVQLILLGDALDRVDAPADSASSIKSIQNRLQNVQVFLQDAQPNETVESKSERTQAAESDLAWIVEAVESLEGQIATQFETSRKDLAAQQEFQSAAQKASLFTYGILLCLAAVWSSRRLAQPVDSLAQLAKHSIGTPITAPKSRTGPKEFREIATSIYNMTTSLESLVAQRTEALEGQVREHLNTQESLTLAHAELQQSIEDLEEAQLALVTKERLSALGEMVGGISHDFNNVLVPIISYSSILIDQPDIESDERLEFLKIVLTAAEDAARIIERLQVFNRSTEPSARNEEIDIDELVEDAVAMSEPRWRFQEDLDKGSISVTTELGGVGTTFGNAPEIRQALINVIFNAVDALPDGGEISISTRREEDSIVLTVKDNGMGMSEETLAACVKPFFSTKNERGTGLGLAMVKNTAESHHGKIEVNSTLGEGTSIGIWLKITKAQRDSDLQMANPSVPAPPEGDSKPRPDFDLRILLVDDEQPVLNAHAAILRHLGYEPQTSSHPIAALEKLKSESFDLIITDLRMPEMSGVEFARRANQMDSNCRIFLLTAYEGDSLVGASQLPFIDVILRKPAGADKLGAAISKFLITA